MTPKCSECQFYEPDSDEEGQCHARPPQVVATADGRTVTFWPQVEALDWCGSFKVPGRL